MHRTPSWTAAARAALLMALTAALTACGPGTGGTGSGNDVSLAAFGAQAAPVCGASFATQLVCPPSLTGAASAPVPAADGTQAVRFIAVVQGSSIVAQFNANSVVLDLRCLGLNFAGDWGLTAQGEARYFGSYLPDGTALRVAGSISVQVDGTGAGAGLVLTLHDADGKLVLGAVRMVRAPATLPAPGPC